MKAMLMAIIIAGFLAFWGFLVFRSDMAERNGLRGEAVAANYVFFRKAVFEHVFSLETALPGTLSPDSPALRLPHGWQALGDWRALLQKEGDGFMYCYVHGPAAPEAIEAAQKLLNHSRTLGYNDGGVLSGSGWPLPAAIPTGNLVSLIRIDNE